MLLQNIFLPLLAFLVSAAVASITMPWLLRLCKKKGLYDLPDERKVHTNNIPRLGGAVFVPSILLGRIDRHAHTQQDGRH